jgi:adenylate cyclase
VGSPVNHIGRIESFTVGSQILVSEATLKEAGDIVEVGDRITVDAKGARGPLAVYDLRGLGGEYRLFLSQRRAAAVRLDPEVAVRFNVLEGKLVGTETLEGSFVELSTRGAVMRTSRPLRALSNLKIRVWPRGEELPGDLYGKVVDQRKSEGADLYAIRFTSIPGEVESWLSRVLPAGS